MESSSSSLLSSGIFPIDPPPHRRPFLGIVALPFLPIRSQVRAASSPSRHFGISSPPSFSLRKPFTPTVQTSRKAFSTFGDLLKASELPLLVDFYATWCGPCKIMGPVLEEVSEKMKDRVRIAKVNTDKYGSVANRYKVKALPTFILFVDGKPVDRVEGTMDAPQLIERIESVLSKSEAKVGE